MVLDRHIPTIDYFLRIWIPIVRKEKSIHRDTYYTWLNSDAKLKTDTIKKIDDLQQLCQKTAQAVSEGKVIGWFHGRMEWGPRALGNRSIVCDPRRRDMKDILNLKIKRRESFRPFAPSIHLDATKEYFEIDYPDPFMLKVYKIRPEKRDIIPAVNHAGGTGRLQTVRKAKKLPTRTDDQILSILALAHGKVDQIAKRLDALAKQMLNDTARERIRTMVESTDGFYIAEMDLKLAWAGRVFPHQAIGAAVAEDRKSPAGSGRA